MLLGLFVIGCVLLLWAAAAQFAPYVSGSFVHEIFTWIGGPIAAAFALFGVVEVTGAAALIAARRWARWPLLLVSVVQLWIFPIGTLLAGYTLWVLFRKPAVPLIT
ncbi:MAG: hypothetical protein JWP29_5170 [Rhodoferax sp.]|nr:hypothetical protein [Rhodoferax sp.]